MTPFPRVCWYRNKSISPSTLCRFPVLKQSQRITEPPPCFALFFSGNASFFFFQLCCRSIDTNHKCSTEQNLIWSDQIRSDCLYAPYCVNWSLSSGFLLSPKFKPASSEILLQTFRTRCADNWLLQGMKLTVSWCVWCPGETGRYRCEGKEFSLKLETWASIFAAGL